MAVRLAWGSTSTVATVSLIVMVQGITSYNITGILVWEYVT